MLHSDNWLELYWPIRSKYQDYTFYNGVVTNIIVSYEFGLKIC